MAHSTLARDPFDDSSNDKATLLQRISNREDQAWRQVLATYRPCVLAQAGRYRLDHELREDLQQRVWLLLLQHARQIRDPDRLAGWLATTARREAWRLLQQRRREVALADPNHASPRYDPVRRGGEQPDLGADLIAAEQRDAIRAAVALLPTRQRAVIERLMDGETSYHEVSAQLGMPQGSIGPTRMRALATLRRHLQGTVNPLTPAWS